MNEKAEMKTLADNLWNNFFKHKVSEMLRSQISFYRAKVTTPADRETMTVGIKRPFEADELFLPYVVSAESVLTEDAECIVFVLGEPSNAIVVSDGKLSTI